MIPVFFLNKLPRMCVFPRKWSDDFKLPPFHSECYLATFQRSMY